MGTPVRVPPVGTRRSLIDQTLIRCLGGLESILTSTTITKRDKSEALDRHVYNCVNSVLSVIYPLVKKPRYVALAVTMIEDAISGLTGTPITSGMSELFNARQKVLDCLKAIATTALMSRRWQSPEEEKVEEELTRLEMRQLMSGTKDIKDFVGLASGIQLLASRVLSLIDNAETELDIVDADTYLETAYVLATRIAVDKYVRRTFASTNVLTSDFEHDPVACLRKTYEEYTRKLEALLTSESPSASLSGRAWHAYTTCVDYLKKGEASPCRDFMSERDKELCAKEKCASAVIETLPSIIERLGVSTMPSPQAVY